MNTKDIRACFKWSQKDMAKITGIPLRTIENWDNRGCMKPWLHAYILKSELARFGLSDIPFYDDELEGGAEDTELDECPLPFG